LGINLTAADTVIIFDSDWNPQNDVQAQARAHRIGQTMEVKVYRLITAKTYEHKMFERASLKLGLEQAIMSNLRNEDGTVSTGKGRSKSAKSGIERLLRHGAYDIFEDDGEDEAKAFEAESIDAILERRSRKVVVKDAPAEESTALSFSKASFDVPEEPGLSVDDPDFWDKLMPDAITAKDKAIAYSQQPRIRQTVQRYGTAADKEEEDSDFSAVKSDGEGSEASVGGGHKSKKKRGGWSLADLNTFRRCVFSFGFGNWDKIALRLSRHVPQAQLKAMGMELLRVCASTVEGDPDATARRLKEMIQRSDGESGEEEDDEDAVKAAQTAIPPGVFNDVAAKKKAAQRGFARCWQVHLSAMAVRKGVEAVPNVGPIPPTSWWKPEHDLALLQRAVVHGLDEAATVLDAGLTPPLHSDGSKLPRLDPKDLKIRLERLVKCFDVAPPKKPKKAAIAAAPVEGSEWSPKEEKALLSALFAHGLPRTDDLAEDWVQLGKWAAVARTPDDIAAKYRALYHQQTVQAEAATAKAAAAGIKPPTVGGAQVSATAARRAQHLVRRLRLFDKFRRLGAQPDWRKLVLGAAAVMKSKKKDLCGLPWEGGEYDVCAIDGLLRYGMDWDKVVSDSSLPFADAIADAALKMDEEKPADATPMTDDAKPETKRPMGPPKYREGEVHRRLKEVVAELDSLQLGLEGSKHRGKKEVKKEAKKESKSKESRGKKTRETETEKRKDRGTDAAAPGAWKKRILSQELGPSPSDPRRAKKLVTIRSGDTLVTCLGSHVPNTSFVAPHLMYPVDFVSEVTHKGQKFSNEVRRR